MEFKDYYKVLGVAPEADLKTIKSAYRKLARKYHPDVSEHQDAENKFKEVTEAWEVLGDAQKRAEYDELRQYGGAHGQSFRPPPDWQPRAGTAQGFGQGFDQSGYFEGGFSDFFESLFGAGGPAGERTFRGRGQDLEMELPVFLEDTLKESAQQVSYKIPQYNSEGRRRPDREKTLKVKIPAGVSDGERIRLKGQGMPGRSGAEAGDLYLHIKRVPHPLFDVEAHNLILTLPLAPWEAALGGKITVPTLEGKIQLTIPANSQSGQRLRIKGRGLPHKQGKGDLYAVLNVVMPTANGENARQLWEQLADQAAFDPRQEWSQYS